MDALSQLRVAARIHSRRLAQAQAAAVSRDNLIRQALAEGVPAKVIAQITGLTPARVRQVRDGHR
jgi:hypothetical protein